MTRVYLPVALALAIAMTLIHVFVGGRMIAEPLLASDLPTLPRLTLYLCWHGITVILAGMALLVADALFWRRKADSAYLVAGLAAAITLIGWSLIVRFGIMPLTLPQWIVFAPMSVTAFLGARSISERR
ncbi:MAG: hypothetical protein ACKVS5_12650 [Parvularculaceae bacterium]